MRTQKSVVLLWCFFGWLNSYGCARKAPPPIKIQKPLNSAAATSSSVAPFGDTKPMVADEPPESNEPLPFRYKPPRNAAYQLDERKCTADRAIATISAEWLSLKPANFPVKAKRVRVKMKDQVLEARLNDELYAMVAQKFERYRISASDLRPESRSFEYLCTARRFRSHVLSVHCNFYEGGGAYPTYGEEQYNFLTCDDYAVDLQVENFCPDETCNRVELANVFWSYHQKKYGIEATRNAQGIDVNDSFFNSRTGFENVLLTPQGIEFYIGLHHVIQCFSKVFVPYQALRPVFSRTPLFEQIWNLPP